MKNAVKKLLERFDLKVSRIHRDPSPLGTSSPLTQYEVALLTLLVSGRNLRIVRVGANDGAINDPIHDFIKFGATRTEMILIEPQTNLIPYLEKNYEFHSNKYIFNGAIGPPGELKLYAVKQSFWTHLDVDYAMDWPEYRAPSGITSSDRTHVERWLTKHLARGYLVDDAIMELCVPSLPLTDVLGSLGLAGGIDVLQVDAEGQDDHVLYESGIATLKPSLIFFESCNLPRPRLDGVNDFLKRGGYMLATQGGDTLAIRVGQ